MSAAPLARPTLTAAAAIDDSAWFATHLGRRYRIRLDPAGGWWLVRRRRGGVFLRCWADRLPRMPDNDTAIRAWWFRTAWPELSPKVRAKLISEARQLEGGG